MSNEFTRSFPSDFVWGAATASYQIEGATHEDGRGESVWDRFCATPGKVRSGDNGDVACDFFHRYRNDVKLMKELGLDAFRFSIAWPRVLPNGRGEVNQAGLDFYDRLVDELLANGIEPFATLFHWDSPQALEAAGGWRARETAEAFVEYAEAVAGRLGDRVRHWITHNEPWVHAWIGHAWGDHAPGRTSETDAVAAAHHLLLSHGWAAEAIRRAAPDARVGITLNLAHAYPASESPEDEAAAWRVDGEGSRWFLDPIFRGSYPGDLLERNETVAPFVRDGDLAAISSGACSTISSGRTVTRSDSGSSTSTTRRSNACRRTASTGIATSSRAGAARRDRRRWRRAEDEGRRDRGRSRGARNRRLGEQRPPGPVRAAAARLGPDGPAARERLGARGERGGAVVGG